MVADVAGMQGDEVVGELGRRTSEDGRESSRFSTYAHGLSVAEVGNMNHAPFVGETACFPADVLVCTVCGLAGAGLA